MAITAAGSGSACQPAVICLSVVCPLPVSHLSSACQSSVICLSTSCYLPVSHPPSACQSFVICLSVSCHLYVSHLSSACHCHLPVSHLSSACQPTVICLSFSCHLPANHMAVACQSSVICLSLSCHLPVSPPPASADCTAQCARRTRVPSTARTQPCPPVTCPGPGAARCHRARGSVMHVRTYIRTYMPAATAPYSAKAATLRDSMHRFCSSF